MKIQIKDISKKTFRTQYSNYKFFVMTFGLTNAPVAFKSLMNKIFKSFLDSFSIIYIDDILVYSKSKEENIDHLYIVLEILREKQLFSKFSKCEF